MGRLKVFHEILRGIEYIIPKLGWRTVLVEKIIQASI